jgi:hypothetical protein
MTEETSANFHPDPEMQAQEEEKLMNELGSLSPSSLELPPDAETTGSERSGDDDAKHLATNIETRLSMAQEQFAPDENVKRSSDVVPLTAKFEKFKGHLRSLLTLVKAHQEANSELQNSRTFVSFSSFSLDRNPCCLIFTPCFSALRCLMTSQSYLMNPLCMKMLVRCWIVVKYRHQRLRKPWN